MRAPPGVLSAPILLLLSALLPSGTVASPDTSTPAPLKPCTIHSPSTGSFIDLRPLQLTLTGSKTQTASNVSYRSRGYDYGYNFTLNFCGPVVEELEDVEGVARSRWANISAFYHDETGTTYSLGQENHELLFRGRKLLTNYTLGSPCPDLDADGQPILAQKNGTSSLKNRGGDDDDDDNDNNDEHDDYEDDDEDDSNTDSSSSSSSPSASSSSLGKSSKSAIRRKNTMISFTCDTSPTLSGRPAVSFIGTPDHCTYIFEVRSRYACGGTTSSGEKGTLGPGAVFLVILGIALLVYIIGGVAYRRNVMHQRGWKQIPNYEAWSATGIFLSDITIILFSSCTQSLPSIARLFGGRRAGYHRVGADDRAAGAGARRRGLRGNGGGGGSSSSGDPDAENRLIDSYDEEWEN